MASFADRLPQNAPGKFYVDSTCIDCDACRQVAPEFFVRDEDSMFTYVQRQPVTPEEIALVTEGADTCPTNSIGTDGM